MDSISGCDIHFVFAFPSTDSTVQYKKCVHLWNNFPYISTLCENKFKVIMQGKLFQRFTDILYCSVLFLSNVNTRQISKPDMIHLSHKKSMKYSGHRKLLCELWKLSKFNAFNLFEYFTNTDCLQIPPRENWLQHLRRLTFLALWPWINWLVQIRKSYLRTCTYSE